MKPILKLVAAAICCVVGFVPCASANSTNSNFNLARDFSTNSNPNGVWAYGWQSSLGSTFTMLGHVRTGVAGPASHNIREFGAGGTPPVFLHFPLSNTQTGISDGGAGVYPPGTLVYYAGNNGTPQNFAVARFIAPSNSNYEVAVAVRNHLNGMTIGDSDFHVVRNGTELFGQFLPAGGSTAYTNVVSLAAGDTIDFAVGRGADNNLYHSGLKIQAVITPTVEPSGDPAPSQSDFHLTRDFSTNSNPNGVWSYGWKQALSSPFQTVLLNRPAMADNGVPIEVWEYARYSLPAFMKNPTTNTGTSDGGQGQYEPGAVWFYPGLNGTVQNFGVIRFTAPSNSNYAVGVGVRSYLDASTWN